MLIQNRSILYRDDSSLSKWKMEWGARMDDCTALGADIFLYTRDESRFLRWKESRAKMKLEARKLCRIFNRNVRLIVRRYAHENREFSLNFS